MVIVIHFNLFYSRASKLRSAGQIRHANTFVKNEKLIDEKLFDLVVCNIPETIPICKMFGPRTFCNNLCGPRIKSLETLFYRYLLLAA